VPIHNNATYVAAGIKPATHFDPDEDVIIMTPNAPAMNVETNTADWSGADRCPDQGATLFSAPIPQNWIYDRNRLARQYAQLRGRHSAGERHDYPDAAFCQMQYGFCHLPLRVDQPLRPDGGMH
jgi:hypothetical protein